MSEGQGTTAAGTRDELVAAIRELILRRLHIEVPATDTDLFATGLIDSLGLVELLLALKEEFGVDIDIEQLDIEALSTVDRIADTLLAVQAANGPDGR